MKANKIINFLAKFGTKVKDNESSDYVHLMMDNHKCIEFNGEQFYIPEDVNLSENEEEVYDYLIEHLLF